MIVLILINKNVEQLGITDSSKQKYKVFDSKGNYTAMTGSGRPDVILRKNDGGIAFTYANHFQKERPPGPSGSGFRFLKPALRPYILIVV